MDCGNWKWNIYEKGNVLLETLLWHWNYYLNWIFYELRLKYSWIGINDNWIWDLIINVVNWDGNVLIIIELDKINKFEIAAWYGHYWYSLAI